MALLNYKKKEINAKIVYYGPGLSGKTTNVHYIHQKLKPEHRGKLMSLSTQTDRTLFFDFLPVELGEIHGLHTRFQIYTVPGQVFYNATRKLVLKNVDGVVFVADSQRKKMSENLESLKNLEENLKLINKDINSIPLVMQYNKRDVDDICSIEEMEEKLNRFNCPYVEASAHTGHGVLNTLTSITKMVLHRLKNSPEFMKSAAATGSSGDNVRQLHRPEGEQTQSVPLGVAHSPGEESGGIKEGQAAASSSAEISMGGGDAASTRAATAKQLEPEAAESAPEPEADEADVIDAPEEGGEDQVEMLGAKPQVMLEIVECRTPEKIGPNQFRIPLVLTDSNQEKEYRLELTLSTSLFSGD